MAKGEDLAPGTDAECLAAFSYASLKAPPNEQAACAMARVFKACFPEKADLAEDVGREPWPGATDEMIAELRRKIGQRVQR